MTRYFYFQDDRSIRVFTTQDQSMETLQLRAKLGKTQRDRIGKMCVPEQISQNIAMALRLGFVELTEIEAQKKLAQVDDQLKSMVIDTIPAHAKLVEWNSLAKEHAAYFQNRPSEYLEVDLQKFCVFEAEIERPCDLWLGFDENGPTVQTAQRNLIFQRGLKLHGNFDAANWTSELPLFCLVKGDLRCKNLLLNCWAELVVTGNLIVEGCIFGYDGETEGRLKVHGNASAEHVLSGAMYAVEITGAVQAPVYWLDQDEPTLLDAKMIPSALSQDQWADRSSLTPLVDEAYYANSNWATGEEIVEYTFDCSQALDVLRQGKKLFR